MWNIWNFCDSQCPTAWFLQHLVFLYTSFGVEWWGAGMVICLEWGANDLHVVQLMPLSPHHILLHSNPDQYNLSGAGLAYPGCTGKRGIKQVSVCPIVLYSSSCGISWLVVVKGKGIFRDNEQYLVVWRQKCKKPPFKYWIGTWHSSLKRLNCWWKAVQSLICYSWILNAQLHIHLKKWTSQFKLLYMLNWVSCFNEICRIRCTMAQILGWLGSLVATALDLQLAGCEFNS